MEHFTKEDNEKILKELARVLKPNGKIVLFWPPKFGISVIFLNTTHFILNNILKKNIKLHPDEISLIQSKKQVEEILKDCGFKLLKFYFGPKDLFTHCIVVAKKK
jgi:ubiquinone/menaquinone biosynthesis C-methylase UbiE